jgi:5'(3')-deoxyribonucleotidase
VKRQLRILLDVDGVLADFTSAALDIVAKVCGRRYALADVARFDICDAFGLPKASRRLVMGTIARTPGFVSSMEPLPGALEGVAKLRAMADVYILTTPWPGSPTWEHERREWLAHHFKIEHKHVLQGDPKFLVDGDVFVDDRSGNVRAWLAERPMKCGVLWGTRHNTDEAVPAGAHYVTKWPALLDLARECVEPQRSLIA